MLLADSSRPLNLNDFVGQKHLVGPDGPIRKMLTAKQIFPMIFWGPPGTGKTTLARIIAKSVGAGYHELSAVSAGKADIKKIIDTPNPPNSPNLPNRPHILFLDEIHRFNKSQQDFLLPYVENGTITLIGATTENPSFEVISPLLSRCRTYVFYSLTEEDLGKIIDNAIKKLTINSQQLTIDQEAKALLIGYSNGDGRTALNVIDLMQRVILSDPPAGGESKDLAKRSKKIQITKDQLVSIIQDKRLRYDTTGEEHYNTISSYLKSMRASNVDAALYYLARMVEAGEDPLFIARRMVVFASEDVASPTAIVVADAVFRACQTVGYPECQENLAAGTVYLAQAKKDRSAYDAYMRALDDVKKLGNLPIPMNLRNAPTKLMKKLGYGKGYDEYTKEDLLPDKLKGKKYYLK